MTQKWLTRFPEPDKFYEDIQALLAVSGSPLALTAQGLVFPNLNFLIGLANLSSARGNEYCANPSQFRCDPDNPTQYRDFSVETVMLTLGLISLSWLEVNIRKKTENGHCHNPKHSTPTMCALGSSFHQEPHDDLKSILKQLLEGIENPISKSVSVTNANNKVLSNGNDDSNIPSKNTK